MSEYKAVSDLAKEVTTYVAHLQAENDRLRKLATGLNRCRLGERCDDCPMQDKDNDGWCIRDLQLSELGIEVPE